jgi:hypothetical protein
MLLAWAIRKLGIVEKLGDYCFKLEFEKGEEKIRTIEGGPWRHKEDALIVVHFHGLVRPMEVRIESIQLWARLYDLPAAMMTEQCAKQLGT